MPIMEPNIVSLFAKFDWSFVNGIVHLLTLSLEDSSICLRIIDLPSDVNSLEFLVILKGGDSCFFFAKFGWLTNNYLVFWSFCDCRFGQEKLHSGDRGLVFQMGWFRILFFDAWGFFESRLGWVQWSRPFDYIQLFIFITVILDVNCLFFIIKCLPNALANWSCHRKLDDFTLGID